MVLNRHEAAHDAKDQAARWNLQALARGAAQLRLRRVAFGIHAIVQNLNSLGSEPGLARVKIAQLFGDAENRIGHRVSSAPDDSLPHWQARGHVWDVAVLAVNRDGHASKSRCGNRFDRPPIARMDDVRTKLAHDSCQTKKQKLEFGFIAPGDHDLILHLLQMRKALVIPARGANAMLEFSAAESSHYFQDHVFSAAHIEAIDYVKNAQRCGAGGRSR